jgi:WD40 repeat protein
VSTLLTDFLFLEAKAEAGLAFELAADFTGALNAMPAEQPERHMIELLSEALRRDIHFIARHTNDYPQALFQSLWNTCWWYDSAQAEQHYLPMPPNIKPHSHPPTSAQGSSMKLSELLAAWRAHKTAQQPGFHWLRSECPPPYKLGTGLVGLLSGHESRIFDFQFSPDGTMLASSSHDSVLVWDVESTAEVWSTKIASGDTYLSFSGDSSQLAGFSHAGKHITIYNARSGEMLLTLPVDNSVGGTDRAAFSSDGLRLMLYSTRRFPESIYDLTTGVQRTGKYPETVLSPDGRKSAVIYKGHTITITDMFSGVELCRSTDLTAKIHYAYFSPDDRFLAIHLWDGAVSVLDTVSGSLLAQFGDSIKAEFSPDSRRFLIWRWKGECEIWNLEPLQKVVVLRGLKSETMFKPSSVFSKDGRRIAFYDKHGPGLLWFWGGDARIWDETGGSNCVHLKGYRHHVGTLAFSSDSKFIAAAHSLNNNIAVWAVDSGTQVLQLSAYDGVDNRLAFAPSGAILCYPSATSLLLWDLHAKSSPPILKGHTRDINSVAFSGNGERAATAGRDKTARLWETRTGLEVAVLAGHTDSVKSAMFSPDGRYLASYNFRDLRLWDAFTGRHGAKLKDNAKSSYCYDFSGDSRFLACGADDHSVYLWDVRIGKRLGVMRGHKDEVLCVTFSPDGRFLASGAKDMTIRVWSTETGKQHLLLYGLSGQVVRVLFSPDGRRIAGSAHRLPYHAGDWKEIRLWDTMSGSGAGRLRCQNSVWSLAFSPDGRYLVAVHSWPHLAQVWDTRRGCSATLGCFVDDAGAFVRGLLHDTPGATKSRAGETQWRDVTDGAVLAFFPEEFKHLSQRSDHLAGAAYHRFTMLQLEGNRVLRKGETL